MSFEAMAWAVKQRPGTPTRSLLLLHIASMANDKWVAWPSYRYLADACCCGRRTVVSHIKALVEDGYLEVERRPVDGARHETNRYTLRHHRTDDRVQNLHPVGAKSAPRVGAKSAPGNYHSSETINETLVDDGFDQFWAEYPRKAKKPDGRKAWKQVKGDKNQRAIMDGLARWSAYWAKAKTEKTFIPYPASWLRGEQWNDDPPEVFIARSIPKDDDRMVKWAAEQGFRAPGSGETYSQYRTYLRDKIEQGVTA